MKTRCLVVDDEPLAIRLLANHIAKIDSLEIVASCNNAMQAFDVLQKEKVDLLFLDIKMPDLTGIEFLKTLNNPPKTIITTAYRDYAIEGYDLDIVDYLLKPITFERFFRAIERYIRFKKDNTLPFQEIKSEENEEGFVLIKSSNKHHKLKYDEIVYIESLRDYIKIHTASKQVTAKFKISDIEKRLNTHNFLRVHRSYVINLKKITAYSAHDIELIDTIEIPIGASYKEKVYTFLDINT